MYVAPMTRSPFSEMATELTQATFESDCTQAGALVTGPVVNTVMRLPSPGQLPGPGSLAGSEGADYIPVDGDNDRQSDLLRRELTSKSRMAGVGGAGGAIACALTQHDDQTDEQPGNGGGDHHDTDKTDGPEDDVTHCDLARDRRLVDRLDDRSEERRVGEECRS